MPKYTYLIYIDEISLFCSLSILWFFLWIVFLEDLYLALLIRIYYGIFSSSKIFSL